MVCSGDKIKWARYLRATTYAVDRDMKSFHRWEYQEITTEQALIEFFEHNQLDIENVVITKALLNSFSKWLNSLGYYRADYSRIGRNSHRAQSAEEVI